MAANAKAEANEAIQEGNKGKVLKYDYKVNTNILIGKLKDRLILMILESNPRKRTKVLHQIMAELSRNVVPIRPGRSNDPKTELKSNKFPLSRKRCL